MQRKRWMFAFLAILPTLVIFAYVRIYPIGDTLRLSLHKWDILSKNKPFIGLANFEELSGDPADSVPAEEPANPRATAWTTAAACGTSTARQTSPT